MASGPTPLVTAINSTSRPPAERMRSCTRATLAATTAESITPPKPSLQEGRNVELVFAARSQVVIGVGGEQVLTGVRPRGFCASSLSGSRLGPGTVPTLEPGGDHRDLYL